MSNISIQEMVNMIFILGECEKNCLLASRMYAARYPDAEKKPRPETFRKVMERFVETGNVSYEKRKVVNKAATNEENELAVLLAVENNPNISASTIARDLSVSERSVGRILKKHKYHPYHIELHQELYGNDFENRMIFCDWMLNKIQEVPDILNFILFSDEATFKSSGTVNRHNMHYYATENPHWIRTIDRQNVWSINVWGGILGPYIIGPQFFEQRLTGEVYLNFLQQELPNLIQHVDPLTRRIFWFQHDGAPPHFYHAVRDYLNDWKEESWIGRGGPVVWPPRSPDLTPLDFYLWGYVKGEIYNIAPTTPEDMKNRIRIAFRNVTGQTLLAVQENYVKRLQLCLQQQGQIFEHLM